MSLSIMTSHPFPEVSAMLGSSGAVRGETIEVWAEQPDERLEFSLESFSSTKNHTASLDVYVLVEKLSSDLIPFTLV